MKRMEIVAAALAVAGSLAQFASAESCSIAKYNDVKIRGYVGERLNACLARHVNVTDGIYLTDVFKNKDERGAWQTKTER